MLKLRTVFIKPISLKTILIFILFMFPAFIHADGKELLKGIKLSPLNFREPEIKVQSLRSGVELYEMEDSSLPFLTLNIQFPYGANSESLNERGSLSALTLLLGMDGAGTMGAEEIAEQLSRIGAKINFYDDYETWGVALTCMKSDFHKAFDLMQMMLLQPQMNNDRLSVVKGMMISGIRQRNDKPSQIAVRKMNEWMYKGTVRGRTLQVKDVENITTDSLRKNLRNRLFTNGIRIGLSGDFKSLGVESSLNQLLEQMGQGNGTNSSEKINLESLRKPNKDAKSKKSKILLVSVPAQQAAIVIQASLPAHNSPDFYALQVGNYILGGGSFNSRMMREIRVKRGLAYSAQSYNSFLNEEGRFIAQAGTKVERAGETLSLMSALIDDAATTLPSKDEMELTKESVIQSIVFQFDDPSDIVASEMRFRRHRMPENYLSNFPSKIRSVHAEDVKRVFRTYLSEKSLYIVVAGPSSLRSELEKYGDVIIVHPEDSVPDSL